MIKAVLAVRQSEATGPRRAVLLALATYADEDGNNAFPKWETLARDSGLSRRTIASAIREALKAGEIECTGQRKSKTKVYSFAPLIHSAPSAPSPAGCTSGTLIVQDMHSHGAPGAPDQAVIKQGTGKEQQQKNPRDVGPASNTGLSVLDASKNNGGPTRFEREQELRYLIAKNDAAPTAGTEAQISEVRASLNGAIS